MADILKILDHPTIFGMDPQNPERHLRLERLKIRGATYSTIGEAPSAPTEIILGYKGRRWELKISEAYETDRHGKRLVV